MVKNSKNAEFLKDTAKMRGTNNIKFIFTDETKIYFFFSYEFIGCNKNLVTRILKSNILKKVLKKVNILKSVNILKILKSCCSSTVLKIRANLITCCNENLIPFDELKKFENSEERIIKNNPKLVENIEFDKRSSPNSFFETFFNTRENVPLVISILPEKIKDEVKKDKVKDAELLNIQIRLTQRGVASVRISFGLSSFFDNSRSSLDVVTKNLKNQAKEYADATYKEFIKIWNENSKYQVNQNQLKDKDKDKDIYVALCSRGIKVEYDDRCGKNEFPLSNLKRNNVNIPQDIKKDTEKMLVGLTVLSYLWPEYTEDSVQKFIKSDLSRLEKEFQFVTWSNALIYSEKKDTETKEDSENYKAYVNDMLLGLELLFMIRTSLQMLDAMIDKKVNQDVIPLLRTNLVSRLFKLRLRSYHNILKYLDRWLLSILGWKSIGRYAIISHFYGFLTAGLEAMRIEFWLTASSAKVELLRNIIKVQYDVISMWALILLTMILAVPIAYEFFSKLFSFILFNFLHP